MIEEEEEEIEIGTCRKLGDGPLEIWNGCAWVLEEEGKDVRIKELEEALQEMVHVWHGHALGEGNAAVKRAHELLNKDKS